MRYAPKAGVHPILGKFVEVRDLEKGSVVTLFTGEYAWQRAEARCRGLNERERT